MFETVLAFALITAVFEALILWKWVSEEKLRKPWFRNCVHLIAIAANLCVHWGTIVGTMTAITAGLVSFGTVPLVVYAMCIRRTKPWRKYGIHH